MNGLALFALMLTSASNTNLEAVAASHLRVLANPKFEGRMTLRPGNNEARDYIARQMESAGLKPLKGNSFNDPFEITIGERSTQSSFASFQVEGKQGVETVRLELGKDFNPVMGSQKMKLVSGSLVFVGSAMPTEAVKGEIAVMYRKGGQGIPPLGQRVASAAEKGARAVVLVGPSAVNRRELPLLVRQQGIAASTGLVAIGITSRKFEELTGMKYGQEVDGALKLPVRARMVTDTEPNRGTSYNVVGVLEGNDPKLKNEYIVFGAHYDHLGYGEVGSISGTDQLHNGADDNASGTAGLIALIDYYSKTKSNRRSIIFQAYSGEEVGLVGSNAWVRNNPEAVKQTQIMINMDMIGRLRNGRLIIYCTASAKELKGIVDATVIEGITPALPPGVPGNSDHAGFVRAGVPALFYHTDLHSEYHTEKDTLDTINFEGIGLVLEHVLGVAKKVDAMDSRLVFQGAAPAQRPSNNDNTGTSSRRVRVGFVPDMGSEGSGPGLRLNGAVQGSPAEAAGIKAGDILLTFDGKPINSMEDLQTALMDAKPNVKVKIKIIRDGKQLELEITPVAAQ